MYFSIALLILSKVAASSLVSRQTQSCTTPSGPGYCGNTANGCSGGTFYAGYCPGASDIQCCVVPCSTPSGSGDCQYTSNTCSGTFVSGYCPGASNYQVRCTINIRPTLTSQCCVAKSSSATGLPGLDISGTPSSSFWSCAASSYKVVALRGYQQACGSVSTSVHSMASLKLLGWTSCVQFCGQLQCCPQCGH
jgi:hypothetical protein